jgi:hypothetical protein
MVAIAMGRTSALSRGAELVCVVLVLLLICVGLQHAAGAYVSEFGTDDASHYVSGLMMHDYLRHPTGSPITYMRDFHSHYPLIGVGHWGPFYYGVEALWMLVFGTGRASVILLSALATTAVGSILYASAAPRFGRVVAAIAAAAYVVSPLTQESSAELMLDVPVALLALISANVYGAYLRSGRVWHAALFGFVAVAALLIKGNAGCIALLPPLAVLIGRRFELLWRPSFWLPAVIAAVVLPWYWLTYALTAAGFRYEWGWHYFFVASHVNAVALLNAVGALLFAAGVAGWLIVAWPRRTDRDPATVAWAALLASVWTFQCVVPAEIQDRYMQPALAPLLLLAALAAHNAGASLSGRLSWRAAPLLMGGVVMAALAVFIIPGATHIPHQARLGLVEAAREAWTNVNADNPAVLVVTGAGAEGAAVAELAMNDPKRPSLFAIRGSRLLGGGGYNNGDYLPKYHNAAEVMAAVDEYRVPLVLFQSDGSAAEWEHVRQTEEAIRQYPDRWQLIGRVERAGQPAVLLYRVGGNADLHADLPGLAALSAPHALGGAGQ